MFIHFQFIKLKVVFLCKIRLTFRALMVKVFFDVYDFLICNFNLDRHDRFDLLFISTSVCCPLQLLFAVHFNFCLLSIATSVCCPLQLLFAPLLFLLSVLCNVHYKDVRTLSVICPFSVRPFSVRYYVNVNCGIQRYLGFGINY